ncbi:MULTISPECIES: response regulator transcription factor [Ramlibacter]|uniref:Response regulator n=1 Tax=Ramlibacter pinisoli TaxID=2682844 RepID=A0A6N8IVK5_9BURK|nr:MULTISPECIES: response regulator [Ramlibacter]MBA2960911.1 response regulator transcription factor [Ramlibacter sp. CGMCC 1.13660]MVQ30857.1 response regulator [Ramlibacter pinisoli]
MNVTSTPEAATVFVVDDDPSVLKSLTRLLGSAGHKTVPCGDAEEFFARHDPGVPGCLLLDLQMPGLNGMEIQKKLAASGNPRPIVFLTGHADVSTSVQVMRAGAANVLTKPAPEKELLDAIAEVVAQDRATREASDAVAADRRRLESLTPREHAVFDLVIQGMANKCIAAELDIVEKTVKVHRGRVMHKLGVRSVARLVQLADRLGLC